MISHGLKKIVKHLLSCELILYCYRRLRRKRRVIVYHGINDFTQSKVSRTFIDNETFEKQIRYLKKYYACVPLSKLLDESGHNNKLPYNAISITFDDGYENNIDCALPLLMKYGFTATIFICPKLVEKAERKEKIIFWWDIIDFILNEGNYQEFMPIFKKYGLTLAHTNDVGYLKNELARILPTLPIEISDKLTGEMQARFRSKIERETFPTLMNWQQIKELRSQGVEFGAHTMSHAAASRLPPESFQEEFLGAKENIEEHLNEKVVFFAFPYGESIHYTEETIEYLKNSGYKNAFLVLGWKDQTERDPFCFNRTAIVKGDSFQLFKLKASGLYEDIRILTNKLTKVFRYN